MADIGGDRGDWTVVRSRKRKATELDQRGRDRSRGSDGQRGATTGNGQLRYQGSDRGFKEGFFDWQRKEVRVRIDGGNSNFVGGRVNSTEWHSTDVALSDIKHGYKASFYVTNFPENLPLFRLRQAFEVCGILSDLYVARHRNAPGQEFGFVRFVNVKNKIKLLQALNSVWVGECRVRAKEAMFDRFAHNDVSVVNPKILVRKEGVEVVVAAPRQGEGVKQERKGDTVVVKRDDERKVTVGMVVVSVAELGRKKKVRLGEGVGGELSLAREEEKKVTEKKKMVAGEGGIKGKPRSEKNSDDGVSVLASKGTQASYFILIYKSSVEDRSWARSGMVSHVKAGDSALSFQQWIEDAGFPNVVVTPLGGDRVFLNCTGDEDFSKVLSGAQDFFGMLFSNFHKWSESLVRYERGAWLHVYGIHVHAWNDVFFRLCVSGISRFVFVDECTADKARLDFARILIATPNIEIVNKTSEFVIDGDVYSIKIMEEWECNLGEDAFMSEAETDTLQEAAPQFNNLTGID